MVVCFIVVPLFQCNFGNRYYFNNAINFLFRKVQLARALRPLVQACSVQMVGWIYLVQRKQFNV